MKKFAVIPTRNDAWVLRPVLATASLWADYIIVADENSSDATPQICKEFPKVTYINFQPKEFNESNRRQILLEAVRQYDGNNLIFGLDSDEILSAEVLNSTIFENFVDQMKPGMSAKLQWIMLWKNTHQYRYDTAPEWSANYKHFVYYDDRKIKFDNVRMHSARVPEVTLQNSIEFSGFRVLHYAFAEWERMLAKHEYYLALEKTMGSKVQPYLLNRKYRWFYKQSDSGVIIKDLPDTWISGYTEKGINPFELNVENLYWYETEVLKFFKKYGLEYFKHLNIWQKDWEEKRQLAVKTGERGIFEDKILNPQPFYDRVYYKHLQQLLDYGGVLTRFIGNKKN